MDIVTIRLPPIHIVDYRIDNPFSNLTITQPIVPSYPDETVLAPVNAPAEINPELAQLEQTNRRQST